MSTTSYNFTSDFQDAILACLIRHPEEFYAFGEIIKSSYFTGPAATEIVHHIRDYRTQFGKYPNFTTLGNFAFHAAARVNPDHAKDTLDYVEKLAGVDTSDKAGVLALSIKFARERAIYDAIRRIHAAQVENKAGEVDPVAVMQEAMKVGTNMADDGVSLYHDYEPIIRKVTDHAYGVHTGYAEFDKLWKHGWAPGWLIVLLAPPKSFKCLGKGTSVMMADGTCKNAECIEVGDRIMGDDSTPRNVITCGKGTGPLYTVSQAYGKNFVCNDAHILCVQNANGTVQEITAEDYAAKAPWFKRTWKGYKNAVDYTAQPVPLDPYLLGLWLGDGTAAARAEICVGDADIEIADFLRQYAADNGLRVTTYPGRGCRQFKLVVRPVRPKTCTVPACGAPHSAGGFCHRHYCAKKYRGFRANAGTGSANYSNPVVDALRALNQYKNKHVPAIYMKNSRQVRLQLLAGLIDSDGTVARGRGIGFINTSERLATAVYQIALSLGFRARIKKYKTSIKSINYVGECWQVWMLGNIQDIPIKLPRKKGKPPSRGISRCNIDVKPIGIGDYYGFEIDGNRRFMLEDGTVTHNTGLAINLALGIASGQDADVLYYACELTQELAAYRAITNVTGWTQDQFDDQKEKGILMAGTRLKERLWGNIWFKSYPSKSTSISEIKAHARHTIGTYGLKPKAIIIDYAETVRPDSVDKKSPDWRQQADIYTQARAMGAELGCCVIMPDRCNKETVGRRVPSMKSFQGAFEKAGIVDAAIGICATEEEYQQRRIRYFVFLNRHGEALKHYTGKVDPERMQMTVDSEIDYDPDEDEDGGDAKPRRQRQRRVTKGAELTQQD